MLLGNDSTKGGGMGLRGEAAIVGYTACRGLPPEAIAGITALAAGAILTMLANTMMPEAFDEGGTLVGIATTLGFAVAFAIHLLD